MADGHLGKASWGGCVFTEFQKMSWVMELGKAFQTKRQVSWGVHKFVVHSVCYGQEKERYGGPDPGHLPGEVPSQEGLTAELPRSCPLNFHLHPPRKWVFQETGLGQR